MPSCASSLQFSLTFPSSSSSSYPHRDRLFVGQIKSTLPVQNGPFPRSVIALSRRQRNSNNSPITPSSSKKNQRLGRCNVEKEDDLDEDAFEALFRQLEEDLKNDEAFVNDGDDEISEEDLVKLERELEEAIGDDELLEVVDSTVDETDKEDEDDENGEDEFEDEDEDEDEDKDEIPVKLKNWQLRRLAYALKKGRRKTSIKSLAAELCLDRAIVLEYLREPPPSLLMLSAALPDKPDPVISEPIAKQVETVPLVTETDEAKPEAKVKVPVHAMQSNWSAQKRLKKVQVETLEQVYSRTKRPTNSMVGNIVHLTNLPRKRVVKWFEDKRAEDGVTDHRSPYQRPASETVFNS